MSPASPPASLDLPDLVVHYAYGPPFLSMMDLDEAGREAVLRTGRIAGPERYRDPTYIETRARVEATLHAQLVAAGGEPLRARPHYALFGRSARSEAAARPGKRAYLLRRQDLPEAQVSFTWGDSFTFDAAYRAATGKDHPAGGRLYRLHELGEVLERWAGSTGRPAWQELELQLWFDPKPGRYTVLDFASK